MSYGHIPRKYWEKRIEDAWKRKSVIWLSGVRRAGKTVLCQSLPHVEYFDCELPRIRQLLEDPEAFLKMHRGKSLVLDEVHRLQNPSELLKIAADHFAETKIIATGSSTLEASAKFKDTLTGRREKIWLTPMLVEEGEAFGNAHLEHRFLFGGLPPFFLNAQVPERDFQDWVDSYWAKDIQELYRLEKRYSFQKFL
jgi:predicted AAA+ superfamily ATPase